MLRPACLLPAARLSPPHGLLTPRSGTKVSLNCLGPATRRSDAYQDGTLTRWTCAACSSPSSPLRVRPSLCFVTHHARMIGRARGTPWRTWPAAHRSRARGASSRHRPPRFRSSPGGPRPPTRRWRAECADESTRTTAIPDRRRPDRLGRAPADERQGGDGLRRALRRRDALREGLQGGDASQLPPGRRLHREPQGEEHAAGPRDGQGHALRPRGAGGGVAERRGRCAVPPRGGRRARAQAATTSTTACC